MNVVFVCVDCLREDLLRSTRSDTPFLDSIRKSGTDFTNLFSTASTTTPSVASFMTGLYSEQNGVNSLTECRLRSSVPTLAEYLSDNGWHTAAEVAGPLVEETDLDRGFHDFTHRDKSKELIRDWSETLKTRISELKTPYFLYLHLWDLHKPLDVPDQFDTPEYGELEYERVLSALDRSLADLFESIDDNTLLVLHGDHGESVTWRNSGIQSRIQARRDTLRYNHGTDTRRIERSVDRFFDIFSPDITDHFLEKAHGSTTYDFMTNVPLLLNGPDIPSTTVSEQCRQVDIFPTILDLMNIPFEGDVSGESLVPVDEVSARPAYIRACGAVLRDEKNWSRAIRYDGMKYIEYPNRNWPSELYKIKSDENELYPVNDDRIENQLKQMMPNTSLMTVDEQDVHDNLKDLGYLD